jgi:transcriptional regulator with XRE-family HTH domain
MNETNNGSVSLAEVIRQRRSVLQLKQQEIADALRVLPESIGNWERGKRRIDLDRVPPLAAILRLNQQDVCRLALFETHPRLYATLFGADRPLQPRRTES